MSVGENIKLYRKEKNLTQGQLAELIGVSTQAVSKWETGAGMPDISQVVPLARVLEISTDKLLGHTDEAFEKEAAEIRSKYGGINFISDQDRAENLYDLSAKFFNKHPDVPDIALVCLECFVELYSKKCINLEAETFMEEAERYVNSIFRYETDPDRVCKTYYLMSRAYDLCDEKDKSRDMLKKIPYIFGDRDYWEAEVAYADKKYEEAFEKIRKSFAVKARFVSRCIRLAARITRESNPEGAEEKALALEEYMLRIIDAFLSGGDYLPYRQIFQKTALLPSLVAQNVAFGNMEQAKAHMQNLLDTRDAFFAFLDSPEGKDALMFPVGDEDGIEKATKERITARVERAQAALNNV